MKQILSSRDLRRHQHQGQWIGLGVVLLISLALGGLAWVSFTLVEWIVGLL